MTSATFRALHSENVRSILALVAVVGGGLLLAGVWFRPTGRDPSILVPAIVGVITSVLGWYFGARGVEQATEAAAAAAARNAILEEEATAAERLVVALAHRVRRDLELATERGFHETLKRPEDD